jgi:hypothetical protein
LIKYTQNPRHKLPWVEYARQARLNIPCKPGLAMVVDVPGKAEGLRAVLRAFIYWPQDCISSGQLCFFRHRCNTKSPKHRYHGHRETGGPDFLPTRTNMESPKVR